MISSYARSMQSIDIQLYLTYLYSSTEFHQTKTNKHQRPFCALPIRELAKQYHMVTNTPSCQITYQDGTWKGVESFLLLWMVPLPITHLASEAILWSQTLPPPLPITHVASKAILWSPTLPTVKLHTNMAHKKEVENFHLLWVVPLPHNPPD